MTVRELGALALLGCIYSAAPNEDSASLKPGTIERVAMLHTARSVHTATTLASGQVLMVGGMTSQASGVSSVELFDPANNSVSDLPALNEGRLGHTATLLRDGRVLVAGGYNGAYLRSLEVFDPSTRRFTRAGSLQEARSGHTATLLPDGRVLFVGGVGPLGSDSPPGSDSRVESDPGGESDPGWTFLKSAEVYDPSLGESRVVGSMSVPRESHTATLLPNGRVLIVGGHSGRRENMVVYSSTELLDIETGRFSHAGELAIARHKHDAIALADGRVLVVGGADRSDRVYFESTEIYDPSRGAFERGPSMANQRYKIATTSVLLPTGDVLVTSGARNAEILRRGSAAFQAVPGALPQAYHFAAAALLPGGDVVISGGYSDANDNAAGIWRFRSATPNAP